MKKIKSLLAIVGSLFLGELASSLLPLPIPGTIYGMLIFLLFFLTGLVKVEDVNDLASLLLAHMTLYFIPPAVGIMNSYELISEDLIKYVILIIVPSILTMSVTGLVVKKIIGEKDGK